LYPVEVHKWNFLGWKILREPESEVGYSGGSYSGGRQGDLSMLHGNQGRHKLHGNHFNDNREIFTQGGLGEVAFQGDHVHFAQDVDTPRGDLDRPRGGGQIGTTSRSGGLHDKVDHSGLHDKLDSESSSVIVAAVDSDTFELQSENDSPKLPPIIAPMSIGRSQIDERKFDKFDKTRLDEEKLGETGDGIDGINAQIDAYIDGKSPGETGETPGSGSRGRMVRKMDNKLGVTNSSILTIAPTKTATRRKILDVGDDGEEEDGYRNTRHKNSYKDGFRDSYASKRSKPRRSCVCAGVRFYLDAWNLCGVQHFKFLNTVGFW